MLVKHLLVLAVAFAAFAIGPVRASCAAPWLSIDGGPSVLRVGQTITIRGEGGWGDFPCNDTGGGSMFGCSGDVFEDEVSGDPDQNIEIRLYGPLTAREARIFDARGHRPRFNRYTILETVDANADGYFKVELQVPDVEPGRYVIDTPLHYDDAHALNIRSRHGGMDELQEKATADGRISRPEAIRLAIGVRKMRLKDAEAMRGWFRGRRVWHVTLYERLGCHYTHTIDARTGEPVGDTGGGGCY